MDPATQATEPINRRLRHLLQTHQQLLEPELLHPDRGAVLIEPDQIADSLLLVRRGRLAIEIHQNGHAARTIAEVGAGAVLGEMALFGIGEPRHGARVRVLEPTRKSCASREKRCTASSFLLPNWPPRCCW